MFCLLAMYFSKWICLYFSDTAADIDRYTKIIVNMQMHVIYSEQVMKLLLQFDYNLSCIPVWKPPAYHGIKSYTGVHGKKPPCSSRYALLIVSSATSSLTLVVSRGGFIL